MENDEPVLFEGIVSVRTLIETALSGSGRKIDKVLYGRKRMENNRKEYEWLKHRAGEMDFSLLVCGESEIDAVTEGTTHGGIAAYAGERSFHDPTEICPGEGGFYVWMEGIEDPFNFGFAIRSLYASGADGIFLSPRNWMSAAGTVCRSSAGASELIPMYRVSDPAEAVKHMKELGFTVVCADLRDAVPLSRAELKKPLLLIVGGEKRGISRSLLELADLRVAIDYGRVFPQSLSAASAAAIFGYEICRMNL